MNLSRRAFLASLSAAVIPSALGTGGDSRKIACELI
jgi:hypothetical protein